MAAQLSAFKAIDNALALYYQRLGHDNYRNADGNGIFLQYIIDEELLDDDLPIEKELGDTSDPNDCAYSWMNNETEFPIPHYVVIDDEQKEAFIFYVLQYCYKHSQPPSDQYIQQILIPKVGGTISNTIYTPNNQQPSTLRNTVNAKDVETAIITKQASIYEQAAPAPIAYTQGAAIDKVSDDNNTSNHVYSKQLTCAQLLVAQSMDPMDAKEADGNDSEAEGVPQRVITATDDDIKEVKRLRETEFKPIYPARAHLNIFTAKELTKELRDVIDEEFDNELILYYYKDISTALQINDHQMTEFTLLIDEEECTLSIINYDLHIKGTGQCLYGVIVPNDNYRIQQDKWLWKLHEFMTADQIERVYKIKQHELPKSSRLMPQFQTELGQTLVIEESLIDDTDWFTVRQIKSLKRNVKVPKITVTLSKEIWIKECKKSFQNVDLPLIPVVVNKNNNHWIEWIKIVHIESQNIYVGISCKYDEENGEWSVESICLDRGDISNKHRLVGLKRDKYNEQLKNFKTSITEIKFSDNESEDIDKKINTLKQQIKSQQDSIVRLKESLLRAKNANKYNQHNGGYDNGDIIASSMELQSDWDSDDENEYISDDNDDIIPSTLELQSDWESDQEMEDDTMGSSGDAWLDQIVDDVIKMYDVFQFKTSPIGAKRNIYIDKQFTKAWMNYVTPKFNDEAMMYYWLDYTMAMQMMQGHSKKYVNKQNRKFMVAIINYELRDNQNNILYGIILCDKLEKKHDKYQYKLSALMTKRQIRAEYDINAYDLPCKSRKNKDFINKLSLKRGIIQQDLNNINWSTLNLFESQSMNDDPINKSIEITEETMNRYCSVALERLNNNNNNNLIPIVVIDKNHNYYGIEWVLIVHIIHRNCDVGISFRYDDKSNVFVATAIYSDKEAIESKHKLIGLKNDYCKHLRPFSLRKLKFKSDRMHSVHNHGITVQEYEEMQREIMCYKKALETEQLHTRRLQQSLQQKHELYLSEINALKQQSQQCLMQQQVIPYPYHQYNIHINHIKEELAPDDEYDAVLEDIYRMLFGYVVVWICCLNHQIIQYLENAYEYISDDDEMQFEDGNLLSIPSDWSNDPN